MITKNTLITVLGKYESLLLSEPENLRHFGEWKKLGLGWPRKLWPCRAWEKSPEPPLQQSRKPLSPVQVNKRRHAGRWAKGGAVSSGPATCPQVEDLRVVPQANRESAWGKLRILPCRREKIEKGNSVPPGSKQMLDLGNKWLGKNLNLPYFTWRIHF